MDGELARSDGARVDVVDIPAELTEAPTASLAPLDVSKLPGAVLVSRRAFEKGTDAVHAGCARAPSDRWVDGIQGVLFERATALALRAASVTPSALAPVESESTDRVFRQRLEGRIDDRPLSVEHALFFVGARRDVELCTVVAVGAPRPRLEVSGKLEAPPAPGLLLRTLVGSAEHPVVAGTALAVLGALIVALVLWRRPRTRGCP